MLLLYRAPWEETNRRPINHLRNAVGELTAAGSSGGLQQRQQTASKAAAQGSSPGLLHVHGTGVVTGK